MFADSVLPALAESGVAGILRVHRSIRCFGAGESHVEHKLGDLTRRGRDPEVGITASEATISLRITATGNTREEAWARTEPDAAFVRERLGELVFGEDEETLHGVVTRLLQDRGLTVSVAESCTGGLLGHWLTEIPGVSGVFLGGVCTYSNDAKTEILGVDPAIIERHGAVSPECAEAMAVGCRRLFGTDLALATTGVAGPGGGTPTKPVGLVYTALAAAEHRRAATFHWPGERSSVKIRSAKMALNQARLHLLGRG